MEWLDELAVAHPRFDADFRARLRELFAWRRDVRRFKRDALPPETIEHLIEIACLSPSVGLSQPWRFVIVDGAAPRSEIRKCFETCNADALATQAPDRAALYARLKLAGLDDAPTQIAVFADHATAQGSGLGRLTMPETIDYSVAIAIHTLWLCRAGGRAWGRLGLDPRSCAHGRDPGRAERLALRRPSLHRDPAGRGRHPRAGAGRLGASPPAGRHGALPLADRRLIRWPGGGTLAKGEQAGR